MKEIQNNIIQSTNKQYSNPGNAIYHDIKIKISFYKDNDVIYNTYMDSEDYSYSKDGKDINLNLSSCISKITNDKLSTGNYDIIIQYDKNVIYDEFIIKQISPSKTEIRLGNSNSQSTVEWNNWCLSPELLYSDYTSVIYINKKKYRIINAIPDYGKSKKLNTELDKAINELNTQLNTMLENSSDIKIEDVTQKKIKSENNIDNLIMELSELKEKKSNIHILTSLVLKLDRQIEDNLATPFNDNISIATEVFADRKYDNVYIYSNDDNIKLIDINSDKDMINDIGLKTTSWETYNSLLLTRSGSLENFISSSKKSGVENLSIDFSNFSNHVYFGNAEQKFKKSFNKIKQIQLYKEIISDYTSSDSYTTSKSYSDKISSIENNMSQYENYMYTLTASYAWPKTEPSGAFYNYSYTSSLVKNWYNDQVLSSSNFDKSNVFSIEKLVPETMLNEDNSTYLSSLLYTYGEFFDFIKSYIDQFSNLYKFDYDWFDSIPKELLHIYGDIFQYPLVEGYDTKEISSYLLGENIISGSIPYKDITQEKWLRLLSSVPYLNKIRGTRRSIDALLNIYGIPDTILRIKEYGETKSTGSDYIESNKNTYALLFSNGGYMYTPEVAYGELSGSDFTYELKFNTTSSLNMKLFGNDNFYVYLNTGSTGNAYGTLNLNLNGSDIIQISGSDNTAQSFYDGKWHYTALQRTGSLIILHHKMFKEEQLFYNTSSEYTVDSTETSYFDSGSASNQFLYIGNNELIGSYSGALQEFRMWKKSLLNEELEHHVYDFDSIATINPYDVKNYLVAQYKMNENHDLSVNAYINDFAWNIRYDASASGWVDNPYINITSNFKTLLNNFTLESRTDNKINIGYNSESQVNTIPKIDIIFSPTIAMNEDIINEMALYDFNDAIGNPADLYEDSYTSLDIWRNFYFTKYAGNFNLFAYIKFIESFDQSVFEMVNIMLPERVRSSAGIEIESPILERPKYTWKRNSIDNESYSSSIDNISNEVFNWEAYIPVTLESSQLYLSSSVNSDKYYLEANRISLTGSNIDCSYNLLEADYVVIQTSSFDDSMMMYYDSISVTQSGSSYVPIYEQLKNVTYNGTQNTPSTDYNGAPWEVSESSATIIRVI